MPAGHPHRSSESPSEHAAVTTAVREAARFDRASVSVQAGLIAAIPVVAVLGGGIAAGDTVAGLTMSAGALLVGIAWRTGGGRPPLALMATDAAVMAISTFVGCVTGSVAWLHVAILCVWSLMAGLLVSVGRRGAVVGTQAIIAAVVFGRFSQPVPGALGLAGLVLAGGAAQVLFVAVVRWPLPMRAQRSATAAAYRALARLASSPREGSTLSAAAALDEAQGTLSSPTLFAEPALMTLRSLVNVGHRLRVQLAAVRGLLRREQDGGPPRGRSPAPIATHILELTGAALDLSARTIEGDSGAVAALRQRVAELSADVNASVPGPDAMAYQPRSMPGMSRRLLALAGQLRAIAAMAPAAGAGAGLSSRRPRGRTNRPLERLRADLAQIRANARLDSPAGRHALRLAVVVLIAELIALQLPLHRGYWLVVAAAAVLRPEFGATFTRGTERALGTCMGVGLAGAIAVGLHPSEGTTVAIVGLLAWAGYTTFPASFAVGFGFITAAIVFLLNVVNPDTLATALARLLDTLVGGSIGLLAYALWPTWSKAPARHALADLLDAQRAYLRVVLVATIDGSRVREEAARPLARRARKARTEAEATVARSLSEPVTRRIDAEQSQGTLGALARLVAAAHALSLDAQEDRDRRPLPTLAPLAGGIDRQLRIVEETLRTGSQDRSGTWSLPDLRAGYATFDATCSPDPDCTALLDQLDEIVDVANGLAALAGLESAEADQIRTSA